MPVKRTNKHKSKSKDKVHSDSVLNEKLKKKMDLIHQHGAEFLKSHICDYEDILHCSEIPKQIIRYLFSTHLDYSIDIANGFNFNEYYVHKWTNWEQYGKTWKMIYEGDNKKIPYCDFVFDKIHIQDDLFY